jgi:hypothetical protein
MGENTEPAAIDLPVDIGDPLVGRDRLSLERTGVLPPAGDDRDVAINLYAFDAGSTWSAPR